MNDNSVMPFGATLYVPALRHDVGEVRRGSLPGLGSMVICLEDAVRDDQVEDAIQALRQHLMRHQPSAGDVMTYVRPRSPGMLRRILAMPGAEFLRGFVLPKATPENIPEWSAELRGSGHAIMPTIETVHAFDMREVARIRDQVLAACVRIDAVRIGGNDILATIGARRSNISTLYEGPLGPVVTGIVGVFAGTGITLSSPVLEHYASPNLLEREIQQDIEHGILNKTAIHPSQVQIINDALRPTAMEYAEAQAILAEDARAVFGMDGSMCEPKTHAAWAKKVMARQRQFGIRQPVMTAIAAG